MEKLADLNLRDFTEALSSKAPVPGGGGASALAGALAAALCMMVGNLTAGKKKYADFEEECRHILKEVSVLQEELLYQIDEDAENFYPLSQAYGLPRTTEEEKAYRDQMIKQGCIRALKSPVRILELCHETLPYLEKMAEKGSVLAISDAGCSAVLLKSALQSAYLNVLINLNSIRDEDVTEPVKKKIDEILKEDLPLCDRIYETVLSKMK